MTISDWILVSKKIAVGLALTAIPVVLIGGGLWLTRLVLERSVR